MTDYRQAFYQKYISEQTSQEFSFSQKEFDFYVKSLSLNYLPYMPDTRDARTLELGCGPGFFLSFLESHGFHNNTGIDISPEQVETAREKTNSTVLEDNFVDFLSSTEESYDLVVIRHVLEHFTKEECMNMVNNIHHVLNDNGRVIIEVPNAGSPIFGPHSRYVDFTHEVGFTAFSLTRLLQAGGFDIVHSGPFLVLSRFKRFLFSLMNGLMRLISSKPILVDTSIYCVAQKKRSTRTS